MIVKKVAQFWATFSFLTPSKCSGGPILAPTSEETMKAAITAIGGYVPEYVLTNDELATMVDTNDEWITTRTGIKERRILKPEEGMGASYLAIKAVEAMKEEYGVTVDDVDLVILASVTPDILRQKKMAMSGLSMARRSGPQAHTILTTA